MGTSLCDVTVTLKHQRKIVNIFFLKQNTFFYKKMYVWRFYQKMHTELHSGLHYLSLWLRWAKNQTSRPAGYISMVVWRQFLPICYEYQISWLFWPICLKWRLRKYYNFMHKMFAIQDLCEQCKHIPWCIPNETHWKNQVHKKAPKYWVLYNNLSKHLCMSGVSGGKNFKWTNLRGEIIGLLEEGISWREIKNKKDGD